MKRIRLTAILMIIVMCLAACGKTTPTGTPSGAPTDAPSNPTDTPAPPTPALEILNGALDGSDTSEAVAGTTKNFIKVSINVYYNDAELDYFKNEAGNVLYISKEGTYVLTFDCDKDLSEDAKALGVSTLSNLTAVYLLDAGAADGAQSPLKAANIKYEKVVVDGKELTITNSEPKSAFKSSGIFDTNDPINSWDGSAVEEVAVSEHVLNFTDPTRPKTISITFTLDGFVWGEDAPKDTPTPTPSPTQGASTGTGSGYTNTAVFSNLDFANMDAITLSKYMGNGINLGNTFEAYGHTSLGVFGQVSSYETLWGQPVTTEAIIKGMKDCGFDTIRIPVAWTNMMPFESGDYTINTKYLDRVQQVVDWAIKAEMFVILNDHWDGGWWGMFGSKTPETVDKAWALYESMWKQIAERFKDYPELLIFESANEELGNNLNDNTLCTDSGSLSEQGKFDTTNAINQKFVDVIRASGGKNANRFLLIAGFNTDITHTLDNRFKMPSDTAEKKLFVSVHYYDPWNYCGAENDARWGLKKEYESMNDKFASLKKFTDAGYGVIIGEYGALPMYDNATKTHTLKQNTYEYTENLLNNCDVYNYVPVLWSCNDFYRRELQTMYDQKLTDIFTSRCYAEEVKSGEDVVAKAKAAIETATAAAIEMWEGIETYEPGTPVAWIMWNGGAGTYSVGDVFNPADNTEGITAHNTIVDKPGSYEVSLDFAGGNDGLTFAALAVADGEVLYPGSYIVIDSITIDGNPLTLTGVPYTTSDDGKCLRVNLLNEWVDKVPDGARCLTGAISNCSAVIVDKTQIVGIKNITIKFRLIKLN
ncbi:MAG: glycoside hydrolase family 5 protein [Lachnospiraceae bacterium]|nr:glycoside hydrolase family 5 protein [Lachnospiraceae bacterium]